MRILIVSQYFWPEDFRINELATGLAARGHEVAVLTGMPNYPTGRFFERFGFAGPWTDMHAGVRIIRAPLVPRGSASNSRLALNYLSFALSASVVACFRCRKGFDAIFVHGVSPVTAGFPAIIVRTLTGAPLFFWVLDLWPESLSASGAVRSPLVKRVAAAITRVVYRFCDVILASSRAYEGPIRRTARANREVVYFPQWSSADEVAQPEHEPPDLPKGFRVMFTGNVGGAQDFEALLDAAELLRSRNDIHWIIVGDGHKLGWVREQVALRGLADTVHCLGRFPSSVMPGFFARADALLATLRKDPIFALTVPAKIQSYLAAGRPIITAIDGEVARIVEASGAGIAAPASDPRALAEAVSKMASMSEAERAGMGLRARAFFESEYERERLIDSFVGMLETRCAAMRPPAAR